MHKHSFNQTVLSLLIAEGGFGSTGSPESAARFLAQVLELIDTNRQALLDRLMPVLGMKYLVLYWLDNLGLVSASLLSPRFRLSEKGRLILQQLQQVDWDQPSEVLDRTCHPSLMEREIPHSADPYLQVCSGAALSECGCTEAAMEFLYKLLVQVLYGNWGGDIPSLIPDAGMRQFMLYQLEHLGLRSGEGKLTAHGDFVLAKLEQLEYEEIL
jgi:hypothetical protein